ncbi:ruBisCO-associated protein-like [Senna tora]|uniref:RuBisCO-associated protein-like n=1 Tax=Senna tora TaxID=362788 RepID=A0A834XH08_9FABA|nr:ruBisCO-associated protein-like [Senna tora]
MEVILEKEKLNKLESQLEVKKEDLSHRTKEYEELKKEVEALRAAQLKAISGEMHVVLAFARDYNENGTHMDGIFKVFFDKKNVTPKLIADFKLSVPSDSKVKFFLSLTGIIEYKFDGIDVYYSRIGAHVEMFVDAIGKESTQFDYVVYQTQDDAHKNRLINPQELITDFKNLVSNHRYPTRKLLVGHSILPKDWDKVAYPLILAALPQLFRDDTVQGTSVWAITDDKE